MTPLPAILPNLASLFLHLLPLPSAFQMPWTQVIPSTGTCVGIRKSSNKNGRKGTVCGIRCSNHSPTTINYSEDTHLYWLRDSLAVFPFLRGITLSHTCAAHSSDVLASIVDDHIQRLATPEQIATAIHLIQNRFKIVKFSKIPPPYNNLERCQSSYSNKCRQWDQRFARWGVKTIPKWADLIFKP